MTTKSPTKHPIHNIGLILFGTAALLLGLVGLIIPVIPGILFLLVAAGVFAQLSPFVRSRLDNHPRMTRFFRRLDASQSLSVLDQCKLTFFASMEAVTRPIRRS